MHSLQETKKIYRTNDTGNYEDLMTELRRSPRLFRRALAPRQEEVSQHCPNVMMAISIEKVAGVRAGEVTQRSGSQMVYLATKRKISKTKTILNFDLMLH